jgi:hypothetical protein
LLIELVAAVLGALGALLLLGAVVALFRARFMRFAARLLLGATLLALGTAFGALAIGMQGYRALTREDLAARIAVQPTAEQRFRATIAWPDGRRAVYELAGDEIYVDAHILKWHPWANYFGLHPAYELSRLAGRYRDIEAERRAPRTVYSLAPAHPLNLFDLRNRHAFLAPLVDAEYGSATFVPVSAPAELELRVSTTGLLMRERAGAQ